MKRWKKQIYFAMRVLIVLCVSMIVCGIFIALYSAVGEKNDTLGVIGAVICFGGVLLSVIVGKAGSKLADSLGPLEPEPVMFPEGKNPSSADVKNEKIFSMAGMMLSFAAIIVMIGGIVFAYFGNKVDDEKHSLAVIGILIAVAPPLLLLVMALIPEKARGVRKKPRRLRALEILIILSILLSITGVFSAAGIVTFASDKKELMIVAGIFAVIGVEGLMVFPKRYRSLTGTDHRIEVFTSDTETENAIYYTLNKMGVMDTADEEQEKEIRRIDEQNRQSGAVPMTKEQVEQYEDQIHGRK